MRRIACTLGLLTATTACNGSHPSAASSLGTLPVTTATPEGSTSTSTGSTGGSTSPVPEDSTSATSTGAANNTTMSLDVGMPDLGAPGPEGCQGKIDFLFVIARGYNMDQLQYKLNTSLPKFITTIQSRFADFDYHIMVVDTEPEWGTSTCNEDCTPEACGIDDYPCDLLDTLTPCDTRLGAGTVFNAGQYAYNKPCNIAGGKRYLAKGQPDLEETFQCIAQVGIDGRNYFGQALADAVSPAKTADCNGDFIRDDALLFVSIIHYTTDGSPDGTPEQWAQAVLDAKHGDPNAIVMFDLGPMSKAGWTGLEDCADHPQGTICRLVQFFPNRLYIDNAVPSFGAAFEQAADLIEETCSVFIPK